MTSMLLRRLVTKLEYFCTMGTELRTRSMTLEMKLSDIETGALMGGTRGEKAKDWGCRFASLVTTS